MPFSFTDEMLKESVIKADLYEINSLPPNYQIEHIFSPKFERKMKALIRRSRNSVRRVAYRHKWLVAVLVAVMILASVMSVSAVRQKSLN